MNIKKNVANEEENIPIGQSVEIEESCQDDETVEAAKDETSVTEIIKRFLRGALEELGVSISDSKKNPDGSVTHKMSFMYRPEDADEDTEDKEVFFYVNGMPVDDDKKYIDLSFKYPDPKNPLGKNFKTTVDRFRNVLNQTDSIVKKVMQFLNETYKIDSIESIPSGNLAASEDIPDAKMLKATFQKIKSSTGYDVKMSNVFASYAPAEALIDLQTIANDEEFVDSLPLGELATYGANVTDEGIELAALPEIAISDTDLRIHAYGAILDTAYRFFLDCKYSGYTAAGCNMTSIQYLVDNFTWKISDLIDNVSKMMVEDKLPLVHPIDRIRELAVFSKPDCTKWEDFSLLMWNDIADLIDAMMLYQTNLSADKQEQLRTWIRSWTYEKDYTLEQARK